MVLVFQRENKGIGSTKEYSYEEITVMLRDTFRKSNIATNQKKDKGIIFYGWRVKERGSPPRGTCVVCIDDDDTPLKPVIADAKTKFGNDFEWSIGYKGFGAYNLALSILTFINDGDDDIDNWLVKKFVMDFVAKLPATKMWELSESTISDWLAIKSMEHRL